jgi:hypothetical protein
MKVNLAPLSVTHFIFVGDTAAARRRHGLAKRLLGTFLLLVTYATNMVPLTFCTSIDKRMTVYDTI